MKPSDYYKEGGEAAASAFGVTHGTPKPPPSWSSSWLKDDVKGVHKKVTIPSVSEAPLK